MDVFFFFFFFFFFLQLFFHFLTAVGSSKKSFSFISVSGTPKCCHTINEILKQAVKEAELYQNAGVVSVLFYC